MTVLRRSLSTALATAALLALPVRAAAQPSRADAAEAQAQFDAGMASMKSGNYAEACPKLQKSQDLDPGTGTKYRLAECLESGGSIAAAYTLFLQVVDEAKKAGRSDRETLARQHADALKPRLPMLTITIPAAIADAPGLEVKRNGELVARADFGRRLPVDPGAHTITATAPARKAWQQSLRALEGGSLEVTVALEDAAAPAPPPVAVALPVAPAPESEPSGLSGRRIAGVTVGSIGVAGLVVGGVFGGLAKAKWDGAKATCKGGDLHHCTPTGVSDGKAASGLATGSTVGLIAGGTAVAAGVILFLTAPSRKAPPSAAWQVVPSVGPGGASAVVQGGF